MLGARGNKSVESLRLVVERFRLLLEENNRALDLMADAEEKLDGDFLFDMQYLRSLSGQLEESVRKIILELNYVTDNRYLSLMENFERIRNKVVNLVESRVTVPRTPFVLPIESIDYDLTDAVGEKIARLGELRKRFGFKIPEGFAITTYTCKRFLEKKRIFEKLAQMDGSYGGGREPDAKEIEEAIGSLISASRLPWGMKRAIKKAVGSMKKEFGHGIKFAVRSSAMGEDGELSYAGLYDSILGVRPQDVPGAYLKVLAGLFNSRAVEYRRSTGEPDDSTMMAAGCLKMVPAAASGVLYTLDPNEPRSDALIVTAVPGLGKPVVEGIAVADTFVISRTPPHRIISSRIADKKTMYEVGPEGGVQVVPVEEERRNAPAVSEEFLDRLAKKALRVERYMKAPQDIEWSQDKDGNLVLLQTRSLNISDNVKSTYAVVGDLSEKYPVLISNRGVITCKGIAYGRVFVVADVNNIADVPENSVLVAHHSSPHLAGLAPKINAVITDVGAPTGHLATITREFRVPSIMDVGVATEVLKDGDEVTVDAEENVIYRGKVDELLLYQALRKQDYVNTREYRLLHKVLKIVSPLNLRNPRDSNFTHQNCRTYHDIIRFAHEKAVDFLTHDFRFSVDRKVAHCKKLLLNVPLDLMVIDVGSGLAPGVGRNADCTVEQVQCRPLRMLLEGLNAPGVWSITPAPMDLESLLSSMTGPASLTSIQGQPPLPNLAVVSDRYMNLNLHLGYHFNQVDTYISEVRNDNYIYFRFSGGMTKIARRTRRAKMISDIMTRFDFAVDTAGDFIVARLKKFESDIMLERMKMIGLLIGFTRQIDVNMVNDSMIEKGVEDFMQRFYSHGVNRENKQ